MDNIWAPFTEAQIRALNRIQRSGWFYPLTCAWRIIHPGIEGVLVAGENGWHCPACDYTQAWAYEFMADPQFADSIEARQQMQWADWVPEEC